MRKLDPKSARLAEHPARTDVGRREIQLLAPHFDEVTLPAGTVLMRQGLAAGETFLIRTGHVVVTIDGDEVAWLGPGAIVGEMAVLARAHRNATVTAISTVDAFVVTRRELLLPHARERGFADRLADTVAGRAR